MSSCVGVTWFLPLTGTDLCCSTFLATPCSISVSRDHVALSTVDLRPGSGGCWPQTDLKNAADTRRPLLFVVFFFLPPPRIVSPLSHFKHSQSFIRCNFSLISLTSFPAISLPFAILGSFSSCVHSIQICLQFFCDSPNYFLILCIFHLFHRPLTFWL